MRRKPSDSARTVALATVFCALGIAFGCGRERFDLLSDASLVSAGRAGSAGVWSGGNSGSAGKASGGAGKGGELSGFGGFGGRLVFNGGGAGNSPCLGEGGCPDERPSCPLALPFCTACTDDAECFFDTDTCDQEIHRCVECKKEGDCPAGQRCNPTTLRCAKACTPGQGSCGNDQRSICSADGVCVSCTKDPDCNGYPSFSRRCYMNVCVECFADAHCQDQDEVCIFGHCEKR